MPKSNDAFELARQTLEPMLADPRRGGHHWRNAAKKLTQGAEAMDAWRLLSPSSQSEVLTIMDLVRQSCEATESELSRTPSSAERSDILHIIKKADELKKAIRTSPLPGGVNYGPYELKPAQSLPPAYIDFGWHSTSEEHSVSGYCVSVDGMLDWAIERARAHLDSLPLRAGTRKRGDARTTVFVRHLAWHFGKNFGDEGRGAIGHIASALFDLASQQSKDDPLTHAQVEARLKDRPPQFDGRPKAARKRARPGGPKPR